MLILIVIANYFKQNSLPYLEFLDSLAVINNIFLTTVIKPHTLKLLIAVHYPSSIKDFQMAQGKEDFEIWYKKNWFVMAISTRS